MDRGIEIFYCINRNRLRSPSPQARKLVYPGTEDSVTLFHRSLPGYRPTPLCKLDKLAKHLGISDLWVKNEADRFDLKAFKVLGASYAIGKILAKKLNLDDDFFTFDELLSHTSRLQGMTFVTATDGNHGRAVAWTAEKLNCKSVVYLPENSSKYRLEAIRHFGAEASIIKGNYDEAVRLAAEKASENRWHLVQDTSWAGYEEIPNFIMQGYFTLLIEALQQLEGEWPSHIFLQAGVGSMAASLLAFLCHLNDKKTPYCIIVEAVNAACFYESTVIDDGKPHAVKGDLETVMAGLACGEPSAKAWEILRDNADAFMACSDQVAIKAMRLLANPLKGDDRIVSGESGSVTTGLVYELLTNSRFKQISKQIGLASDSKILVISTEGDTDPDFYLRILE